MAATYASALAVCAVSLAIGQAAVGLCGGRRWSWLAPGVGLALLCSLCWATVRMPGDGAVSAVAAPIVTVAAVLYLRLPGRLEGGREAAIAGLPVALAALAAASLPFVVEGRFGILGTSFNPDMSQHLLAADRLADGQTTSLLTQGYPLGPHAIVVALNKGLGVGLVQGFNGLTLAIAVLASLTALGALSELTPPRRTAGALLAGLPYMVVSYLAQGAFKETMQALFLLAFAVGLLELSRGGGRPAARSPLRALPLGLLAAGSVFAYSFPGLTWLAATAAVWAALELLWLPAAARGTAIRAALPAAVVAAGTALVLGLPELGRMADFGHFETFDPAGPGLGNLFGQISPAEALGIWPSGDFRLEPGDGAVPAIGYYAGVALALALLAYGLVWALRRRESAIPAAFAAAVAIYAAARIGGTPYTAAKAVVMIAPPAMLLIVRPLLALPRPGPEPTPAGVLLPLAAAAFLVGAAACSILALANGPVGPTSYTSALTELRPRIADGATVMLAPRSLLETEHGVPYLAWELRGGRVCIEVEGEAGGTTPAGVRYVIAPRSQEPPFRDLRRLRDADGYRLWARSGPVRGASDCPLIAVRQARQGARQS